MEGENHEINGDEIRPDAHLDVKSQEPVLRKGNWNLLGAILGGLLAVVLAALMRLEP